MPCAVATDRVGLFQERDSTGTNFANVSSDYGFRGSFMRSKFNFSWKFALGVPAQCVTGPWSAQ